MRLLHKLFLRIQRPLLKISSANWSLLFSLSDTIENSWAFALRYLEVKGIGEPFVISTKTGHRLSIKSGDELTCVWDCWIKEDYPIKVTDSIIVDAGANFGAFSLFAATRNPDSTVFAFEPVSATFSDLQSTILVNRLTDRIKPFRVGVAGQSGTRTIQISSASPYSSMYAKDENGFMETISVLSLAGLFDLIGNPEIIHVLKMDCEGGEMECLLDADASLLKRCRRVLVEYHEFSGIRFAEIRDKILACGFALNKNTFHLPSKTGIAWFTQPIHF